MSVYKKPNSPYWQFDFQYQGRRFYGSTGVKTKARAEAVEAKKRFEAANGDYDRQKRQEAIRTLDAAVWEYWEAKDLDHCDDPEQAKSEFAFIINTLGADTPINKVGAAQVSKLVAARKKLGNLRTGEPLAPATLNHETIQRLRPVLRHARLIANSDPEYLVPFPEIPWGELTQHVPKPQPIRYKADEITTIIDGLKPHVRRFAHFQMRYALRISEMFFPLSDIDIEQGTIAIRGAFRRSTRQRIRKNEKPHIIALLPDDIEWIREAIELAQAHGIDTIWTRWRTRGRKNRVRVLEAMTQRQAAETISRTLERTGMKEKKGVRGSHSFRHHGAMTMLKATGNMRVTQHLLGHSNIQSTQIYAHVDTDDLLEGLKRVSALDSRTVPESRNTPEHPSQLREKSKKIR